MKAQQCWALIEKSRQGVADCDEQVERLKVLLDGLAPDAVVAFDQWLQERLAESYQWDLWAVAYIINGGCSDDGFDYFRGWLIAQGQRFYETVLKRPEHAARRAGDGEVECEGLLYVAQDAYRAKTGQEIARLGTARAQEPLGEPWDEDDLPTRYPRLWARFS